MKIDVAMVKKDWTVRIPYGIREHLKLGDSVMSDPLALFSLSNPLFKFNVS